MCLHTREKEGKGRDRDQQRRIERKEGRGKGRWARERTGEEKMGGDKMEGEYFCICSLDEILDTPLVIQCNDTSDCRLVMVIMNVAP